MNIHNIRVGKGHLYLGQALGYDYDFSTLDPKTKRWSSDIVSELNALKKYNIDKVIMLQTNEELSNEPRLYRKHMQWEVTHFPISDYSVPQSLSDFHSIITDTCRDLMNGKNILVHCMGGNGRTGLFAAGILVRLGYNHREAKSVIRKMRPTALEMLSQEQFLKKYEAYLETLKQKKTH